MKKETCAKYQKITILTSIFIFVLALALNNAFAADPGHGASSIGAGAFEAGNYSFHDNVGIGIAVPTEKLTVNGSLRVDKSDSTPVLSVNISSGNVGIGNASPGSKLDVTGYIRSNSQGTNPSSGTGIEMVYFEGSSIGNIFSFDRAASIYKNLNLNDFVMIKNTSYVGIATTTPTEKLNVNGSLRVDNSDSSLVLLVNTSSGYVGIGTNTPGRKLGIYGDGAGVEVADDSGPKAWFYSADAYSALLTTSNHPLRFGTNNDDSRNMILTTAGYVGMGTKTPGTKLEVNGTLLVNFSNGESANDEIEFSRGGENIAQIRLRDSASVYLQSWGHDFRIALENNNLAPRFTIKPDGKIGIATIDPKQTLDVNGSINISVDTGILYTPQICLAGDCKTAWPAGGSSATGWTNTSTTTSTSLDVNVNSGKLFVNATLGKVGIVTAAPNYSLDVNGTIRGQNFLTTGGSPVNDILVPQEIRNYAIPALKGSLGLDTANFVEKIAPKVFEENLTQYISATALPNGNAFIAYQDNNNSAYGTFVIYDSAGNQVKVPTVFESADTTEISSTTLTNGNVLIAYADGGNSGYGTFVVYDSAGNQVKAPALFGTAGDARYLSATTLTNGNVLIAYVETGAGNGTFVIIDSVGNQVKAPTIFESNVTYYTSAAALPNGNVLIAYQATNRSSYGTFVIYDSAGNPVKAPTFFVSGSASFVSATTFINGNVFIGYRDVDSGGSFVILDSAGNEIKAATVFNGGYTSYISGAALPNGNMLIGSRDASASKGKLVIYDSVGNQVKAPTEYESASTYYHSAITLTNGNVLIAYQDAGNLGNGTFVIWGSSGANFANNVGIATTTPTEKLNVNGSLRVDNSLSFPVLLVNASSGNVGIGTTNPVAKLEVNGTILFNNSGNEMEFSSGSILLAQIRLRDDGNVYLQSWGEDFRIGTIVDTAAGTKFTLKKGGNVGIATTVPTEKLTVNGSLRVDNNDSSAVLSVNVSSGNVGIGTASPSYKLDVNGSIIIPNGNALYTRDTAGNVALLVQMTTSNNLRFLTGYNSNIEIYNTAQNTQLMTITNTGRVGIGTINPGYNLEVNGSALFTTGGGGTFAIGGISSINRVQTSDTGSTIRFLSAANGYANLGMGGLSVGSYYGAKGAPSSGAIIEGYVGIGTTNPGSLLTVNKTGISTIEGGAALDSTVLIKQSTDSEGASALEFGFGENGNYLGSRIVSNIVSGGGADLYFQTGTASSGTYTSKMIIKRDGNVGINTTAPTKTLHVAGTMNVTDNNGAGIVIDGSGNVIITLGG